MKSQTLKQRSFARTSAKKKLIDLCLNTATKRRHQRVNELRGLNMSDPSTPRNIIEFHFSNVQKEFNYSLSPSDSLQIQKEAEAMLIKHMISIEDDIRQTSIEEEEQSLMLFYQEMLNAEASNIGRS